jgi:hypothetical protein
MKTTRIVLTVFAAVIIIGQLIVIDFSDFTWETNAGSYLSIISMILLIIAMAISNMESKKKE